MIKRVALLIKQIYLNLALNIKNNEEILYPDPVFLL